MWKEVESSGKWDWEKVKEFEGTMGGSETKIGQSGKEYVQFTIKESTSGEDFKFSGAVLESRLQNVVEGDKVKLTFLGWERSANGKFRNFKVDVWENE